MNPQQEPIEGRESEPSGTEHSCPLCEYSANEPFAECPRCGVVLAKVQARTRTRLHADEHGLYVPPAALESSEAAQTASLPAAPREPTRSIEPSRSRWTRDPGLFIGVAIGLVCFFLPLTRILGSYLNILVHEIGHTGAGWLFGYPTIPSFDFVNHGGLSVYFFRTHLITLLVLGGFVLWIRQARDHPTVRSAVVVLALLYVFLSFTELHRFVFTAMGHGGELLFAALFTERALRRRGGGTGPENAAWAAAATFVTVHHSAFAWSLATSSDRQREYAGGVRGLSGDLTQVAHWTGLDVPTIALLLALVVFGVPAATVWWKRRRT